MHHEHIDKFSYMDSYIHQLNSRVKFAATLLFTVVVIAMPKTSFSILFFCAIGPFAVLVSARIPLKFVFKHILLVSPFILVLAVSCLFYDKNPSVVTFGPFVLHLTDGWLRCFTIIGKFIVTMMALIALISTTRFSNLLTGLQQLGMPKILTTQLGFLYRYIFVLIDRAQHILQARKARKLRNLGFKTELKTASAMLGSLFVRSLDTAENINTAMHARGFNGRWSSISRLKFRRNDLFFALATALFILLLYFVVKPSLQ